MALRRRVLPFLLLLLVLGTLAAASRDVWAVLPLALLLLPLAWGRYVGERSITRLRCARAARTAPPRRRAAPAPVAPVAGALVPRGTALLARHLAVRPPPARVLAFG
jgi:hypothetical protein